VSTYFHVIAIFTWVISLGTMGVAASLDYAVKLATVQFTPDRVTDASARSAELVGKHVLVQFDGPLTAGIRERLAAEGVELLDYIPNFTYTARLTRRVDQSVVEGHGIRWFGRVEPVNKIAPELAENGIGEWARRGEGRAQFLVVFHRDEGLEYWSEYFQTDFGAEIIGLEPSINGIDLIMPEAAYYRTVELDAVVWVKQANRLPEATNDVGRMSSGADVLQAPPYNLSGAGIMISQWDQGHADEHHPDLLYRVTYPDAVADNRHGTHVAGTLCGDGSLSDGRYRGMAPAANLLSWEWWLSSSEAQGDYGVAAFFQTKVTNNSWAIPASKPANEQSCELTCGNYWAECATVDNIVRAYRDRPFVICWGAGNDRSPYNVDACGSLGWTYNTILPYATSKNIVTVGAVDPGSEEMSSYSSWGPCDDGRIKPDVVATGCHTSCLLGGDYLYGCGTSTAGPAVAGTIALIWEQAGLSFPGRLFLSSTIKGIVLNTAKDLGPPGPDFEFGFGKIDGVKAVNKIMDGDSSYVESVLATGGEEVYDLTVPSDIPELRVTLVWDDPGGSPAAAVALVNDLDLTLVDPLGNTVRAIMPDADNPDAPAAEGEDHINNVESISISEPYPGLWKAQVSGYNVPFGSQQYSLVFHPDLIHTPGNIRALGVFDPDDAVIQPGQSTTVEFWVTNVGLEADEIRIEIYDDQGWLDDAVDSVVYLAPFDSAYCSVGATVPAASMAGERDSITCLVTSQSYSYVKARASVALMAGAYYGVQLTSPARDTVASPGSVEVNIAMENLGNDEDVCVVTVSQNSDWSVYPAKTTVAMPAKSDTELVVSVSLPAEQVHLKENILTVTASSFNGASDQTACTLTVWNPNPPPTLISPDELIYTQERTPTFVWEGAADSYSLYIASDEEITEMRRLYTGLPEASFTLPTGDALADGAYWWAVRRYVGADSSSLQRYPRKIVVDNVAPNPYTPTYPIGGVFVGQPNFPFYVSGGSQASGVETSPQFGRIAMCSDSLFEVNVRNYEPVTGIYYMMPDTLPPGRWYWRVQGVDRAGNESAFSAVQTFVLDIETPPVPSLLAPANGGTAGGSAVVFRWATDKAPPYEESAEFYRIQVSESASFGSEIYGGEVYATILSLTGGLFLDSTIYYWRVEALDSVGHSSGYQILPFSFTYVGWVCGDVNSNGAVNIADLTYLIAYLFGGGPPPLPYYRGSVNGDDKVNVSDVTYLIAYLFGGGPAPVCGD